MNREDALIEVMDRMVKFEVRLKEIEVLSENLVKLKKQVELLTLSMETFLLLTEPQKEKKNGCLVGEDILDTK